MNDGLRNMTENDLNQFKYFIGFVDEVIPFNCENCKYMNINLNEEMLCEFDRKRIFEVNPVSGCQSFVMRKR